MEERVGPLTFFSNFDSGNLAKVERVKQDPDEVGEEADLLTFSAPDYEYNVWTWPDAVGTEYENLNRTWFHFGIKGGSPGKLVKINIMNLNRQGKLYNQGMSPFVKVVPGRNKWERIRDRPTCETVDGQFRLSFTYRFPEQRNSIHYFAFCYPYSYTQLQSHLDSLDLIYKSCKKMTPRNSSTDIYFYRELLCKSLDDLRVDLLTVTSCKGMVEEREERLNRLFPDTDCPRPHRFNGKKVYFLSARVHPGETPASFVFNGFLDFILRRDDPRAMMLREKYVFKLIPMLNPDGVKRGHYRTDSRGVNLNRVYLDPDQVLHPSIYAAKAVIMYHHLKGENENDNKVCMCNPQNNTLDNRADDRSGCENQELNDVGGTLASLTQTCDSNENNEAELGKRLPHDCMESSGQNVTADDEMTVVSAEFPDHSVKDEISSSKDTHEGNNSISEENTNSDNKTEAPLEETTVKETERKSPSIIASDINTDVNLCKCLISETHSKANESSLEYYVDLHGHASKRGCFVYANYLENEDGYIQSILYPKLMSINSANFDFTGCNFTEKNMYTKDKRDGMSKEGSGRVAIFKATSIVHSYTLECNYNSGRMLNPVPPATCDSGRATPPPPPGFPPKFTTEIYEEVGRSLAVSVLDMNNCNPWTRLPTSEFGSLEGVRNWIRRFIRSAKNAPSIPKKLSRAAAKTSSLVAGATAGTRQKITSSFKSPSSGDLSSEGLSAAAQKVTERMTQNVNAMKKGIEEAKPSKRIQILAAPRRLSHPSSNAAAKSSVKPIPGINGGQQVYKSKEQLRVSLELPKTGPSLRIPKPNHLSSNIKAISCPADLRIGRTNQVEIHNQFIGLQTRRTLPEQTTSCGAASDEEKKRKAVKKTVKKKGFNKSTEGKTCEDVSKTLTGPTALRNHEEEIKPRTSNDLCRSLRKGSALLQRSNSRNKKLMSNGVTSCEAVDLANLPESSSQSVGYWVELHDLSAITH